MNAEIPGSPAAPRIALADLRATRMRVVSSEGLRVLFVLHENGGVSALSPSCPHYGAPLDEGRLCGDRLYCPWHKAVFDVRDGALLEPPALDGLARWPVAVQDGIATITGSPVQSGAARTRHRAVAAQPDDIVVLGGGAAGARAIRTLRDAGYRQRLRLISEDPAPPYDRPILSKEFMARAADRDDTWLFGSDFDDRHAVERITARATEVDVRTRQLRLDDGRTVQAGALLIATGGRPVRPAIPGIERRGVHLLRSLAQASALREAVDADAQRCVIVGGGFIAMEAASHLARRGRPVTLVSAHALPLARRFGDAVAAGLVALLRRHGVEFVVERRLAAIEGDERVRQAVLDDGRRIACSTVLLALGVQPETDMLRGAPLADDGGVQVDEHLRICERVYAAGDIAAWPEPHSGLRARVEHWRVALQHGECAALNLLGAEQRYTRVPFFWSNLAGEGLDYAGYAPDFERVIVHGDPQALDFIAYYVRAGRVAAACELNRKASFIAFLDLLERDALPPATAFDAGWDPATPA